MSGKKNINAINVNTRNFNYHTLSRDGIRGGMEWVTMPERSWGWLGNNKPVDEFGGGFNIKGSHYGTLYVEPPLEGSKDGSGNFLVFVDNSGLGYTIAGGGGGGIGYWTPAVPDGGGVSIGGYTGGSHHIRPNTDISSVIIYNDKIESSNYILRDQSYNVWNSLQYVDSSGENVSLDDAALIVMDKMQFLEASGNSAGDGGLGTIRYTYQGPGGGLDPSGSSFQGLVHGPNNSSHWVKFGEGQHTAITYWRNEKLVLAGTNDYKVTTTGISPTTITLELQGADASANYSVAIGLNSRTRPNAWGSVAIGIKNTTSAPGAVAMGVDCSAGGICSFADGSGCIARGDYSVALGYKADTSNNYQFVLGISNESLGIGGNTFFIDNSQNVAMCIGGDPGFDVSRCRTDVPVLDVSGDVRVRGNCNINLQLIVTDISATHIYTQDLSATDISAIHINVTDISATNLDVSHCSIWTTEASGVVMDCSLSLNCHNLLDVSGIHFCDGTFIGHGNSFDISTNYTFHVKAPRVAMGLDCSASGNHSVAMGNDCTAGGIASFADGSNCTAWDECNVALGSGADASGTCGFMYKDTCGNKFCFDSSGSTGGTNVGHLVINGHIIGGGDDHGLWKQDSGALDGIVLKPKATSGSNVDPSGIQLKYTLIYGTDTSGLMVGDSNTASGQYAVAMGQSNTASNPYSVALGYKADTSNNYQFVLGISNESLGIGGNTFFIDNSQNVAMCIGGDPGFDVSRCRTDVPVLDVSGDVRVRGNCNINLQLIVTDISATHIYTQDLSATDISAIHINVTDISATNIDIGACSITSNDDSGVVMDCSLSLNCHNLLDVSGIHFCDGTFIGHGNSFDISTNYTFHVKAPRVAMGLDCSASGDYSVAMGLSNTASGDYSVALGCKADTNNNYQFVLGISNEDTASGMPTGGGNTFFIDNSQNVAMGVGGDLSFDISSVRQGVPVLDVSGDIRCRGCIDPLSLGLHVFTNADDGEALYKTLDSSGAGMQMLFIVEPPTGSGEGKLYHAYTKNNNVESAAIGGGSSGGLWTTGSAPVQGTFLTPDDASGIKLYNTLIYGTDASGLMVGDGNTASGDYAVAMGTDCSANGLASFADGSGCTARDECNVALGCGADASGTCGFMYRDTCGNEFCFDSGGGHDGSGGHLVINGVTIGGGAGLLAMGGHDGSTTNLGGHNAHDNGGGTQIAPDGVPSMTGGKISMVLPPGIPIKVTLIGGGGGGSERHMGGTEPPNIPGGGGGGGGGGVIFYTDSSKINNNSTFLIGNGGKGASTGSPKGYPGGNTEVTIDAITYKAIGGAGGDYGDGLGWGGGRGGGAELLNALTYDGTLLLHGTPGSLALSYKGGPAPVGGIQTVFGYAPQYVGGNAPGMAGSWGHGGGCESDPTPYTAWLDPGSSVVGGDASGGVIILEW